LITQHHNEIRNAVGDLAALVWGSVKCEPVVKDTSDDDSGETLIADLCVRGVWLPQTEALFDIWVIDTDAQSYLSQPPSSVLFAAKTEKKRKYLDASVARRAHFTPLYFSVDGLVDVEVASFLKTCLLFVRSVGEVTCRCHLLDSCSSGLCNFESYCVVRAWLTYLMVLSWAGGWF